MGAEDLQRSEEALEALRAQQVKFQERVNELDGLVKVGMGIQGRWTSGFRASWLLLRVASELMM